MAQKESVGTQKMIKYANANLTLFNPEAVDIPEERLVWKKRNKDTGKPETKYGFRCPPGTQVNVALLSDKAAVRLTAGAKTPLAPALIDTRPESPGRTLVYTGGKILPVKMDKDVLKALKAKGAR